MKTRRNGPVIILLVSFLIVILYHYFGYIGHYGYDDMQYAEIADNLNHNIFDPNDHFSFRLPVILLTAVSYRIFGVSDFASALPSIIIFCFILTLVFLILKKHNLLTLITGLSLTLLTHWNLFYSDKLMTDIYVSLSVLFSLFIIYRYKYASEQLQPVKYGILLAFGLMSGFLSKEIIVLIVPLLLYLFLVDIFMKRDARFWISTVITGIILLLLYFFISWYLTGSPFKRFEAIFSNSYLNLCSYDKQPIEFLLKRIFYEFFTMMLNQGMLAGFVFALASLFSRNIKKTLLFSDEISFFTLSALVLFLSSDFMTISFTSYVPMCLDVRHYLFIVPIAAISASGIINSFFSAKQLRFQVLTCLLAFTIVTFFFEDNSFSDLFLPMLVLFVIIFLLPLKYRLWYIFAPVFVSVLMIKPFSMVQYASTIKYHKQKKIIMENFINRNFNCYVITDEAQQRIGNYLNRFKKNTNCVFLTMNQFNTDTLRPDWKKFLLMNYHTRSLSKLDDDNLPFYAKSTESFGKLIFSDSALHIYIWDLQPLKKPVVALQSYNSFENNPDFWEQKNEEISSENKVSGTRSNKLNEFSSTFKIQVDSLYPEKFSKLVFSSSVFCLMNASSEAKLVISVENNDKPYFWQAVNINKFVKAFGNWCQVKYEYPVNTSDIKDNSTLKIFVWNPEKKQIFIDNFNIVIQGIY